MNDSLFDIAVKHKALYAPEGSPDNFFIHYPKFFESIRMRVNAVLEIGVLDGAATRCWKEYFPNAQIVGLDIVDCKQHEEERIRIWHGNQGNKNLLKEITEVHAPFDIIIDDGSRRFHDQLPTFETLFPHVSSKGFYVILGTTSSWSMGRILPGSLARQLPLFMHSIQNNSMGIKLIFTAVNFTLIQKS